MANVNERDGSRNSNQTFTGQKMDWLTATARNAPPTYFKIGFFLAQHLNEETGEGFPSQEWLAELTNLSVETVKRAVKYFKRGGWLTVRQVNRFDPKTGKYKTHNVYSMDFQCVQDALDGITILRQKRRRERSVISDQGVSDDTLTPSESTKRRKLKNRKHESLNRNADTPAPSAWDF
jgi:hypothetical protein